MSQNNENLIISRNLSRVQGSCSLVTETAIALDRNRFTVVPYTGKVVTNAELPYEIAMLKKANILQYKKNSSNLTKKQQYSRIAQGKTHYKKTWATQSSSGYTNPNTGSLQRINSETVELFPNSDNSVFVQDFGTLVCGTIENPVTGAITVNAAAPNCHPTTDSDVPGKITNLCWNDGITPWFPRTRYKMSSSNSGFNTNYKLVGSLNFVGITLTSTIICSTNSVQLNWAYDNKCIPATSFNIYQNDVVIFSVPARQRTITFTPTNFQGNVIYYVTAKNMAFESSQSNAVIVNSEFGFVINNVNLDNIIVTETSLTILANLTIDVICNIGGKTINIVCVGGGGGGGGGTFGMDNGGGGGGGGGGLITEINHQPYVTTYSIIIGQGGQGGQGGYLTNVVNAGSPGLSGGTTQIIGGSTLVSAALGGGGGDGNGQTNTSTTSGGKGGNSTGSGSGGTGGSITTYTPPITSANGGNGTNGGGGGGGSGASGSRGKGGNGALNIPITNYGTIYGAGGGGGGANNESGIGGNENAGNGGDSQTLKGFDGIPNTGGGGGGGEGSNGSVERNGGLGGNGGSGIVIIYV